MSIVCVVSALLFMLHVSVCNITRQGFFTEPAAFVEPCWWALVVCIVYVALDCRKWLTAALMAAAFASAAFASVQGS